MKGADFPTTLWIRAGCEHLLWDFNKGMCPLLLVAGKSLGSVPPCCLTEHKAGVGDWGQAGHELVAPKPTKIAVHSGTLRTYTNHANRDLFDLTKCEREVCIVHFRLSVSTKPVP